MTVLSRPGARRRGPTHLPGLRVSGWMDVTNLLPAFIWTDERKPKPATASPWRAGQGGGEVKIVVVEDDLGKTWPRDGGVAGDGPATLTMYSVAPPPPHRQSGLVRPPPRCLRAAWSPSQCNSRRSCYATLPLGRERPSAPCRFSVFPTRLTSPRPVPSRPPTQTSSRGTGRGIPFPPFSPLPRPRHVSQRTIL